MNDSELKGSAGVIQVMRVEKGCQARVRTRRETWSGMCKEEDRLSCLRRDHTGKIKKKKLIIINKAILSCQAPVIFKVC